MTKEFDEKWNGKIVRVTHAVDEINLNYDPPEIDMWSSPISEGSSLKGRFIVKFADPNTIDSLTEGEEITIVGVLTIESPLTYIKDAYLV